MLGEIIATTRKGEITAFKSCIRGKPFDFKEIVLYIGSDL